MTETVKVTTASQAIRAARKAKKYTLQQCASLLGIHHTLLSKIERGDRMPSKEQILVLARVLNLDQKELLTMWLADRIYNEIADEPYALEALRLAEAQVPYETSISGSIEMMLQKLDSLKKELDQLRPVPEAQLRNLYQAWKVDYTFESNRIEGNTLTLQETALVVERGVTISGKSLREHLEAINHAEAVDMLRDLVTSGQPLNERTLLQIHSLVLRGIDRENAGRYRNVQVRISGSKHIPPQPYLVPKLMEDLFLHYEERRIRTHPVLLAADIHERLVSIHPFIDGNGRTSRLVMNLILMQAGFPPVNISGEYERRLEYYDALEAARQNNRLDAFDCLITGYALQSLQEWYDLVRPC